MTTGFLGTFVLHAHIFLFPEFIGYNFFMLNVSPIRMNQSKKANTGIKIDLAHQKNFMAISFLLGNQNSTDRCI